jgi:ATP-dependent Clp protease ATP-binding subunit ClpA
MGVNLKSLIGKLNDTMRLALEGAAGLCLVRTHYDIEIEHVLATLLDLPGTNAARFFITEVESGARNVDNILTHTLLPRISRDLLVGIAESKTFTSIRVRRELGSILCWNRLRPNLCTGFSL